MDRIRIGYGTEREEKEYGGDRISRVEKGLNYIFAHLSNHGDRMA